MPIDDIKEFASSPAPSAQKGEIAFIDKPVNIEVKTPEPRPVELKDYLALIGTIVTDWPQFDTNEPVNGGDAVEWIEAKRSEARELLRRIGITEKEKPIERPPMAFEYYEVLPCIEWEGGDVDSYRTEDERQEALKSNLTSSPALYVNRDFYTLYGLYSDGADGLLSIAIGDFTLKADAMEVMNAILAPMAKARNELLKGARIATDIGSLRAGISDVANALDDVINQSSNGERP